MAEASKLVDDAVGRAATFLDEVSRRLRTDDAWRAHALSPSTTYETFRAFLERTNARHRSDTYDLLKFVYDGANLAADPPNSLDSLGRAQDYRSTRRQIFLAYLSRLISANREWFPHAFAFYVDLFDASSCPYPELYRALGLPVLTTSHGLHDAFTLAIPDVHMLLAREGDATPNRTLRALRQPFVRGLARLYRRPDRAANGTVVPWSSRQPTLFYRGSCNPTVEPSSMRRRPTANPMAGCGTVALRERACRALDRASTHGRGEAAIDFGLSPGVPAFWREDGCGRCRKSAVPREAQLRYKLLLNIDGFGLASDSSFWKLSSGAAVVWLVRNESGGERVHDNWYSPLLRPYEHFIPATPYRLADAVAWCVADDARCEGVARRSRALMRRAVSPEAMDEYTTALLRRVHDLFPG